MEFDAKTLLKLKDHGEVCATPDDAAAIATHHQKVCVHLRGPRQEWYCSARAAAMHRLAYKEFACADGSTATCSTSRHLHEDCSLTDAKTCRG